MDSFDYLVEEAMELGLTRDEAEYAVEEFYDMDFIDYME